MSEKVLLSWSGGKDSMLALHALSYDAEYEVAGLFTTYNSETERISLHNVPLQLVRKQAQSLGLTLYEVPLPPNPYNELYEAAHLALFEKAKENGVRNIIYGDIFLEPIRQYRDALSQKADMSFAYPLWGEDPERLSDEFIGRGYKAVITAIQADILSDKALGMTYGPEFVSMLPKGADLCGENGEFHTFVFDGPLFSSAVPYTLGRVWHEDYRPKIELEMAFVEIE